MVHIFMNLLYRIILFFVILFLSIGCSTIEGIIHPSEEPISPSESILQKEDYNGPKARVVVAKFIDKSLKTSIQNEDEMAEMLGNALLATNRFIIQMNLSESESKQTMKGADLLIQGTINQFEPGSGLILKTQSYVTFLLKVSDIKTGRKLVSKNVEGKGKPMEEAIKKAIEESVNIVVAKTPSRYYRVSSTSTSSLSPPPPKETSKPPKTQLEVTSLPPTPPPVKSESPLRVIQVVWPYVNMRDGPGTQFKNTGSIKKGTSLGLLEDNGDWLRVRLQDGKEVWVNKEATTLAHKPQPPPSSTPAPPSTSEKPIPM